MTDARNALIGHSSISDRIIKARLQAKPHNISITRCYVPVNVAKDEEMGEFYISLEEAFDSIPKRDVIVVLGDMNAKVGAANTPNATRRQFEIGE